MLSAILYWILTAAALLLTTRIVPGIEVHNFTVAMIAALIMGIINVSIRPLLSLLTLPLTIITFGLFIFVLNALMFGLVAWLVPGFEVSGFWSALFGSLVMAILVSIAHYITSGIGGNTSSKSA